MPGIISKIKKLFTGILLIVAINTWFACSKSTGSGKISNEIITITYTETDEDFANPERGFYRYTETKASSYSPLILSQLQQWRGLNQADGGNYQVYSTLVFRYFVLDIFKNGPLSTSFLQSVKNDFDIARNAGVKLIPRFVYTIAATAGSCSEGFNCPPYGDASKSIILQHIAQLKPILNDAADVIAVMQMGFIGTWGENYYTDYFGDPSSNGQGKLLDNNWQDRSDIIRALLDALPGDRMLQVRTPQMKQRFIYGTNATVNVPALLESEAFTNTYKARIGFHNDCLLSGPGDYGTYDDYGNSITPRQTTSSALKAYAKNDSRYVAVGGETCDDVYSPQNDCEPAGIAETELSALHYSYLNCAYNNSVNNDWQTGGCMMNIRKRLGYRFVLKEFTYPKEIKSGSNISVSLTVNNVGYASPFNERPVKLLLRNKTSSQQFEFVLNTDIRKWFSGTNKIEASLATNSSLIPGTYDLFLYLPDKYNSISSRPEYAIRFANKDVWDSSTGYNNLLASIVVK